MQLFGVRRAAAIKPELVVVAGRIDDERIALERADGMPKPGRDGINRVRPAVHVDYAVGASVPGLVQHVDVREPPRRVGHGKLPGVRVHARHTHGQACGIRFIPRISPGQQLSCPGQQKRIQLAGLEPGVGLHVVVRAAAHPRARKIDAPVGQPRDRAFGISI